MVPLKTVMAVFVVLLLLTLMAGLGIGLWVAWIAWPVQVANVDVGDLNGSSQDDYIVLTASTYSYDRDLDAAKQRLSELHDDNVTARVAFLAQKLATENNPDSEQVANLAIALGDQDPLLAQIGSTATPPPTATAPPTSTPTLTDTPSPTPTVRLTTTKTPTSTQTPTPTRVPTRRPIPTPTKAPAPIPATQWIPSYPGEWPGGTHLDPVSVAPGQKFWHLVKALYCDDRDTRNDCPNLPGGSTGTNIYVMLLDEGGGRTEGSLIVRKDDGSLADVNDIGPQKSATDMCDCNYSFLATHWPISVAGAPSDTLSGLGLYSVRMKLPQAHTKYFLWFQLMTR